MSSKLHNSMLYVYVLFLLSSVELHKDFLSFYNECLLVVMVVFYSITMSILIVTSLGDIVVDLHTNLCSLKWPMQLRGKSPPCN